MIHTWFKKIMLVINCLFALPVILVIIRETTGPGQVRLSRVLVTAALVAIPLAGTLAITIAGNAVLRDD